MHPHVDGYLKSLSVSLQNLILEIIEIVYRMAGLLTCPPSRTVFPTAERSVTLIASWKVAMELTVAGLFRILT